MPTNNIEQRIARLCSLTGEEVQKLKDIGITTEEDLGFAKFVDFPSEDVGLIKRRKLEVITLYLARGNALTSTSTLTQVQAIVNAPPVAAAGTTSTSHAPDPNRGAPKVYTDSITTFSGEVVDYEEWARKAGATIKQTAYKDFLTRGATPGDRVEEARTKELYNMLLSSVSDGHALNTIEKVRDDNSGLECGYLAWKALQDWYLDPAQKDSMIHHWEQKLKSITLDKDTSATEYINSFEMYVRKLVGLGESWSDDKKIREFKLNVTDPDYDTESRVHNGSFADLVKVIRKREEHLNRLAETTTRSNKRTRRMMQDDEDEDESNKKQSFKSSKRKIADDSHGDKPNLHIPFIPTFLYRTLDENAKKNVTLWRRKVNNGETMVKDDLVLTGEKGNDKDSDPPSKKLGKKKNKNGTKLRRVTKTRRVGFKDDTVEIKLASSDSEYSKTSSSFNSREQIITIGDDSNVLSRPNHSIDVGAEGSTIRALKRAASIGMSKGSTRHSTYAVIDPGAEKEIVGGVGWHILHFSDQSEPLSGGLKGMGSVVLPIVDAVTAVEDSDGRVVLIGVGKAGYDRRTTQYESLWNSHHMRSNNIEVDDVAVEVGGKQSFSFTDIDGNRRVIPMHFNGDIMTVNLRQPNNEELLALRVNWITPPMEELTPQSIRRSKRAVEEYNLQVPNLPNTVPEEEVAVQGDTPTVPDEVGKGKRTVGEWRQLLGFPSNNVVEKTLESTTQLQVDPVESERREIPKQHRKKRLLMLYPRRLQGRTDTDTFFSTVKSIRGYLCVQIFCHVSSDFLFVRCMQRESHSHGAYQDYIREVGASETIVTDNSRTQTGKKWEQTSREVMTKQRRFTAYNQNESKVERRIQDVKHKVTLVLQRAQAPVTFWCYALIFVVDCLNHIAKKPLGWRTSDEVLNGDTSDISPFRFRFWEPIKFYAKKQPFPASQWIMGRYLGIAWDTGDLFTFQVWSEPNGKWQILGM